MVEEITYRPEVLGLLEEMLRKEPNPKEPIATLFSGETLTPEDMFNRVRQKDEIGILIYLGAERMYDHFHTPQDNK